MYLNIVKAIYDKTIANDILSGERLKVFLLTLRKWAQMCPLSPLSFDVELKVLARAVKQEEEIKASN